MGRRFDLPAVAGPLGVALLSGAAAVTGDARLAVMGGSPEPRFAICAHGGSAAQRLAVQLGSGLYDGVVWALDLAQSGR